MRFVNVFISLLVVFVCSLPVAAEHDHPSVEEEAAAHTQHNLHDERALSIDPGTATEQIAPVLEGLGHHHHPITTSSSRAQMFFDQGLKLTYGFNHQEALRSFKEAARLDSDAAMAYWGWALVLGPNINLPMAPEVAPQALEAIRLALAHKDKVSQKEQDFIDALATRYHEDPEADRAEPPDWFIPVRHHLGAVLLEAGRAKEAEVVYWQDLEDYPDNGWALFGLSQSLDAQEKFVEGVEVQARFRSSFKDADVSLKSSRF